MQFNNRKYRQTFRKHHNKPCPYCRRKMVVPGYGVIVDETNRFPTRDHVIPKSKGGHVLIVVCRQCNDEKGDMMPDEYVETLTGCNRTRARISMIGALRAALADEGTKAAVEEAKDRREFSTTAFEEAFKAAGLVSAGQSAASSP